MEFLSALSDDQKAILGGMVALFVCGGLASAVYHLGRSARQEQPQRVPAPRRFVGAEPDATVAAAREMSRKAA